MKARLTMRLNHCHKDSLLVASHQSSEKSIQLFKFNLKIILEIKSPGSSGRRSTHRAPHKPACVPSSSPAFDVPCCSNMPCGSGSTLWGLNTHTPCRDGHLTAAGDTQPLLCLGQDHQEEAHRSKSHFSWVTDS